MRLARTPRRLAILGAIVAALALPGTASAHVGGNAPVATNFDAQIRGLTPASSAVETKVVDGDRELSLRVRSNATVLVPGAVGEPLLRFDRAGVFVNLRSLTAQADRIDRFDLRPDPNPHAPPLWHRLTSGHTYLWHEHRLHALEPLALGHTTKAVLGRWSVPLLINGRRHALEGALVYSPPGPTWPWILLASALAAVSLLALALSPTVAMHAAIPAAIAAALIVWALRIARELYGRPSVGITGYVEIALTSLVGIALLYGLLHRDRGVRGFTAFLVGFGALYQGLTMLHVLTHAVALTLLPTFAARLGVATSLGLGAGTIAITLREQFGDDTAEHGAEADAEAEPQPRDRQPSRTSGRA